MTEVSVELASVMIELGAVADDFALRAHTQEVCRDRARPGTGSHHLHAHSVTLWRLAESSLRTRIHELETASAT